MSSLKVLKVFHFENGFCVEKDDLCVREEPLEIRLEHGYGHTRREISLAVTMRTPGNDEELTAGFLFTEGIIQSKDDLIDIRHCVNTKPETRGNIIRARLKEEVFFDEKKSARNFYVSSSCGICGKATLENINAVCHFDFANQFPIASEVIFSLNEKLVEAQKLFKYTGGLHASAIFSATGELLALREDVGRHNALDKLIGNFLLADKLPLNNHILFLSGRVSFELMQKAISSGISCVCAVGAPSSLATEAAQKFNILLAGFLRGKRMNIYHGFERVRS